MGHSDGLNKSVCPFIELNVLSHNLQSCPVIQAAHSNIREQLELMAIYVMTQVNAMPCLIQQ